jgi:hypothetical protein
VPEHSPKETIPAEDREGFARILEQHMHAIANELEQLIEMHDRYGDTLQKSYLYKARHAMKDGLDWFNWARRQKRA